MDFIFEKYLIEQQQINNSSNSGNKSIKMKSDDLSSIIASVKLERERTDKLTKNNKKLKENIKKLETQVKKNKEQFLTTKKAFKAMKKEINLLSSMITQFVTDHNQKISMMECVDSLLWIITENKPSHVSDDSKFTLEKGSKLKKKLQDAHSEALLLDNQEMKLAKKQLLHENHPKMLSARDMPIQRSITLITPEEEEKQQSGSSSVRCESPGSRFRRNSESNKLTPLVTDPAATLIRTDSRQRRNSDTDNGSSSNLLLKLSTHNASSNSPNISTVSALASPVVKQLPLKPGPFSSPGVPLQRENPASSSQLPEYTPSVDPLLTLTLAFDQVEYAAEGKKDSPSSRSPRSPRFSLDSRTMDRKSPRSYPKNVIESHQKRANPLNSSTGSSSSSASSATSTKSSSPRKSEKEKARNRVGGSLPDTMTPEDTSSEDTNYSISFDKSSRRKGSKRERRASDAARKKDQVYRSKNVPTPPGEESSDNYQHPPTNPNTLTAAANYFTQTVASNGGGLTASENNSLHVSSRGTLARRNSDCDINITSPRVLSSGMPRSESETLNLNDDVSSTSPANTLSVSASAVPTGNTSTKPSPSNSQTPTANRVIFIKSPREAEAITHLTTVARSKSDSPVGPQSFDLQKTKQILKQTGIDYEVLAFSFFFPFFLSSSLPHSLLPLLPLPSRSSLLHSSFSRFPRSCSQSPALLLLAVFFPPFFFLYQKRVATSFCYRLILFIRLLRFLCLSFLPILWRRSRTSGDCISIHMIQGNKRKNQSGTSREGGGGMRQSKRREGGKADR